MDTGENKLNAEMMKKLREEYEKYKVNKLEEYEKYKRILEICGINKPKLNSKAIKQIMIDEEESQKACLILHGSEMKIGTIDEFNLDDMHIKSETKIPDLSITIDSIPNNIREKAEYNATLYGDSFIPIHRCPNWIEQYLERQRWIDGIKDPKIDILTGCTQNFKVQSNTDKLEAYVKDVEAFVNLLDTSKPDRNGRIWKKDCLKKILIGEYPPVLGRGWVNLKEIFNDPYVQIIGGRGINRTLYSNIYQMMSYNNMAMSINQMWRLINRPFSTKWNINSVIHMHWSSPDLTDLKARDFRYGKMWEDQRLINYATGDVSHIDRIILDSLATFGPDLNSGYGMSTPNLNDTDKKKLERVIKKKGGKRK